MGRARSQELRVIEVGKRIKRGSYASQKTLEYHRSECYRLALAVPLVSVIAAPNLHAAAAAAPADTAAEVDASSPY